MDAFANILCNQSGGAALADFDAGLIGAVKTGEYALPDFRHDWVASNLSHFAGSPFLKEHGAELMRHGCAFVPALAAWGYSTDNPVMFKIQITKGFKPRNYERIQAILGGQRQVGIRAEIEVHEIAGHHELRAADTLAPAAVSIRGNSAGDPTTSTGFAMFGPCPVWSGMMDVMHLDHVTLAGTHGYAEHQVIRREALPNTIPPHTDAVGDSGAGKSMIGGAGLRITPRAAEVVAGQIPREGGSAGPVPGRTAALRH